MAVQAVARFRILKNSIVCPVGQNARAEASAPIFRKDFPFATDHEAHRNRSSRRPSRSKPRLVPRAARMRDTITRGSRRS